jgi:hypothetical protein
MKTHSIRHQNADLGTVWFVVPMLWAAVALVGFALISNWPELFAQEQPAASVADRSMRQAGGAPTAGASPAHEAAQQVE